MRNKRFKKLRFIVTAGPTREFFDPVRYISNRSSGKMGYAIARAAAGAGHDVLLVTGPVSIKPPEGVRLEHITTGEEMFRVLKSNIGTCDVLIMAAAVCDFKPARYNDVKIKKLLMSAQPRIVPTRDVLKSMRKFKGARFYVGFAAETNDLTANAADKLARKGLDMIVANDVSRKDSGFESDMNRVSLLTASGRKVEHWPLMTKYAVGKRLIRLITTLILQQSPCKINFARLPTQRRKICEHNQNGYTHNSRG